MSATNKQGAESGLNISSIFIEFFIVESVAYISTLTAKQNYLLTSQMHNKLVFENCRKFLLVILCRIYGRITIFQLKFYFIDIGNVNFAQSKQIFFKFKID